MTTFVLAFDEPAISSGDLGLATPPDAVAGTATDLLMTPATTADAIEGYKWIAAVGNTPRSLPARASAQVIEAAEFGVTADADPILTTQQMTNALNSIADLGSGRILQLPYGRINITATDVAAGEGTSFRLGADLNGLHVRGSGRANTTLVAATNRIEMFSQLGATNVEFGDLTFESPSILQNWHRAIGVIPPTGGGGPAVWGNSANCAVRQYTGANTKFRNIGFTNWHICCSYFGEYTNNDLLSGTIHMEDIVADNYVQTLLVNQPNIINFINVELHNGKDSINDDASIDPGHGIYITDKSGAHPEQVMISNIRGENSFSSIIKIRKGQTVVVNGATAWNCGRGVEINNCMRATVSDLSIKLASPTPDSAQNGLNLDNCGIYEIANVFIDMRGIQGYGVRIRPDPVGLPMPEYPCQYGRVSDATVLNDFTGGVGLASFVAVDQNDLTIENYRMVHPGSIANSRWPIYLINCQRARVLWPQHSAPAHPGDAYALVNIDATCVDCSVLYHDAAIDVAHTATTINNVGTGSKITRLMPGTPTTFGDVLTMTPLAVPPASVLGNVAFSDGTHGPDHWGQNGPGLYWWNGTRWKLLG